MGSQERYRNPKPGRSKMQPQRTRDFTEEDCYDGYDYRSEQYEQLEQFDDGTSLQSRTVSYEELDMPSERLGNEHEHTESLASEYKVFIDMTDEEGLGLCLRKSAHKFIVTRVVEGPIKEWNSSNPESQRVREMDELVCLYVGNEHWSLDDVDQHQRITSELGLSCTPHIKLQMRRPSEIHIQLQKKGRNLGMVLQKRLGDRDLSVAELEQGAVLDWNRAHPDQRLECGDLIFTVNQCKGDPKEMGNLLRDCEQLNITARHYGTDQSMDYGTDQSIPS